MVVKVVPVAVTPVLQVVHQIQALAEHKLLVVLAASPSTIFRAMQAVSILVEIHAMNLAAAVVVTTAAAAVEITAAVVVDQATSIREL
jgi:hypothetical protein